MSSNANPGRGHRKRERHRASDPRARQARLLPREAHTETADPNSYVHCGWGKLIFANTFRRIEDLVELMRQEEPDERDIAIYVNDPHVALSLAPQELFLDPSHTYRLWFQHYRPSRKAPRGFIVRAMRNAADAEAINNIYARLNMVTVPHGFLMKNRSSRRLTYLVAEDEASGEIIGTVTGVDHRRAFNDPERGTSLWCLAVDPQCSQPGVGESLVRRLVEHYQARSRSFLDLSVMHDNEAAIALYERLGFARIPAFTLKHKNELNERLYIAPQPEKRLNPYARIIVNEARRRGIGVEIEDAEANLFTLTFGGRLIHCRVSLSDLTTAVAMARCDDKTLTLRLLSRAGLSVPDQIEAGDEEDNAAFLEKHERIVVKPVRGEQGAGISVDVRSAEEMEAAIAKAKHLCDRVLIEQFCEGHDLRVIVIDYKVVAAAIRQPAAITGNGQSTIRELIKVQSRRRAAATGGESRIPMDEETERCVSLAGYEMDDVLPDGEYLEVRKTANLHTGGTIHDVTDRIHHAVAEAAVKGARVLQMPVVGFDFLVPKIDAPDHVIIEANERPGLANHEPQPTAERFIDLLFPQTIRRDRR